MNFVCCSSKIFGINCDMFIPFSSSNEYKNIGYSILIVVIVIISLLLLTSVLPINQYAKYTYENITVYRVDKWNFGSRRATCSYYNFYVDSIGEIGAIEAYGNDGSYLLAIDKQTKEIYLLEQQAERSLTPMGEIPLRVHIRGGAIKHEFKRYEPFWLETETMECYILCAPAYRMQERKLNEEYYPTSQIKPNYIWEDWANLLCRYFLDWLLPLLIKIGL